MKKLILAATMIAFIGIGGSSVHAQAETDPTVLEGVELPLPIECSESDQRGPDSDDDGISDDCTDFYIEQEQIPPPPTTTPPTTTEPPKQGSLPRTGSGMSGPLQLGGILLVIGGIAVVATRRRSTATAS